MCKAKSTARDANGERMPPTFGTGRCDCARSDRVWEVAGGYTSRESHVRRWPDDVAVGESLLGNHAQFCHAFFHISPTPELVEHPGEVCVRCVTHPGGKKCETKGVVVVAALRESDDGENKNKNKVTFLSRYSVRHTTHTPLTTVLYSNTSLTCTHCYVML